MSVQSLLSSMKDGSPHLIERSEPRSIPSDTSDLTQSLFERGSQRDCAVLYVNGVEEISSLALHSEGRAGTDLSAEW